MKTGSGGRSRHGRFYVACSGVSLLLAGATEAQAAEAAQASDSLSTITVTETRQEQANGPVEGYRAQRSATASRTDAAIKDLPFSVNVVTRDSYQDRGSNQLSETLETVPGARFASSSSGRAEAFQLRGFDSYSYVIDGFPLSPTAGRADAFVDLANVERVEVLKGPASVLYGRGQPGGVINVVTRQPTDEVRFEGRVQAGSDDFYRTEGSISGPINESGTLTGRATLAGQTSQGFRDHPISDEERELASVALRWRPDALTQFDLSIDHTHQDMPFDRGLPVTADNKVSLPRDRFLAESWSSSEASVTRTTFGVERFANDWLTLRADVRYDDATVEDTGIDSRNLQDDGRTLTRRYTDRREDNTNLDIRLEAVAEFDTAGIGHELLLGTEYVHSELDFQSYRSSIDAIDIYDPVYGANRPAASFNEAFVTTSETYSLYAQDRLELTRQWSLLAGLRYDDLSQRQKRVAEDNPPEISESAWTGQLGVVYQPVEPLSLYASYSESFTPQTGLTRDNQALTPEKGNQYEVGAKWDVSRNLSVTASVFEIHKEDVATADPLDDDYSVLTGEQRARGAELQIVGSPTAGLDIEVGGAYTDARVTESNDGQEGNRLGGVPYWSAYAWTNYTLQGGMAKGLELGGGAFYTGSRQGDLDNSYEVDGYTRFDARIGYPLTRHIDVALNLKNLTDEEYILAPVSRRENYPGMPRSVLASIDFRY